MRSSISIGGSGRRAANAGGASSMSRPCAKARSSSASKRSAALELGVRHAVPEAEEMARPGEPGADADHRDVVVAVHSSQRIDRTDGAPAAAVLPNHSTFGWWRSGAMSHSRHTASSMTQVRLVADEVQRAAGRRGVGRERLRRAARSS